MREGGGGGGYFVHYSSSIISTLPSFCRFKNLKAIEQLVSLVSNQPEEVCCLSVQQAEHPLEMNCNLAWFGLICYLGGAL